MLMHEKTCLIPIVAFVNQSSTKLHMKRLNKTESPIFVRLCVLCFQRRQTALVELTDQWMACLDKGDICTIFLDFTTAFDLVDHSLLIDKLSLYKCNSTALNVLTLYLQSRQQPIVSG